MVVKKFGPIMKNRRLVKRGNKTEPGRLYPLLVNDFDRPFSWHLKEQLRICEKKGRSIIPPLGKKARRLNLAKPTCSGGKLGMQLKKKL